jgi:two-component system sensor histidine kinase PilS (NtrC family)
MSRTAELISDVSPVEVTRLVPLRYFNLFRLLIAGLFLVAGEEMGLGHEYPGLFKLVTFVYLGIVLLLGFPDALRRIGFDRLIALQVIVDILVLVTILTISGGYRSGVAVMMMVYLAAAGLVAEGRMSMFFAALATVLVLVENVIRTFYRSGASEFVQVGIAGTGFFAIALMAHLLARRAKANESLAALRGEALFRQQIINERIIDDMADGVIVLSAQGQVRQANPRAAELLGVPLRAGMPLAQIDEAFANCVQHTEGLRDGVGRRLGPNGKLLRCRVVRSQLSHDATDSDVLIYLTDFEEIQKQVQQLKLAALGRLTASMAHEIRNPLSAITQAADLFVDERRQDVQQRLIKIIDSNARRIERMVKDVLALGRRDQLLRELLALDSCVREVVEEMTLNNAQEAVIFEQVIDPGARLVIDRIHLHQILSNLLANARRYCSGKPGSIRIFTTRNADGRVALQVVDDGPGVDGQNVHHLFDPFFTTDAKGTGLGLYIARELAEANDAILEFRGNQPGACFVLMGRSE